MFKQSVVRAVGAVCLVWGGVAAAGPLTGVTVNGSYTVSPLAGGFTSTLVGTASGLPSEVVSGSDAEFLSAVLDDADGSFALDGAGNVYQWYFIDFDENGLLSIYNTVDNLAPLAAGSQVLSFDFSGLSDIISSFSSSDAGGMLSVVNDHSVSLDLSQIAWGPAYSTYTAQIGFQPAAQVPVPATLALLGLGLAGLCATRRR